MAFFAFREAMHKYLGSTLILWVVNPAKEDGGDEEDGESEEFSESEDEDDYHAWLRPTCFFCCHSCMYFVFH